MRQSQTKNSKVLGSLLIMVAWLAISTASAYAQNTVTKVTLIMTDTQGNVLMTKDVHGNILARYTYRPYGTQQTGPTNAGPGYTGHVHDPVTGLVYMQQRYYNPAVGRFLRPDPIAPTPGNVFNFGRYTYANDNPLRYIDPDGRNITAFIGGLFYESWSGITGHGFHGSRIWGALKNGYNGNGPGVGGALWQDANTVVIAATGVYGAVKGGAVLVERLAAKQGGKELAEILKPSLKTIEKVANELKNNGVKSLLKSQKSLEKRLAEHEGKLNQIKKAGGHTSSVEREIRGFKKEINAIKQALKKDQKD